MKEFAQGHRAVKYEFQLKSDSRIQVLNHSTHPGTHGGWGRQLRLVIGTPLHCQQDMLLSCPWRGDFVKMNNIRFIRHSFFSLLAVLMELSLKGEIPMLVGEEQAAVDDGCLSIPFPGNQSL